MNKHTLSVVLSVFNEERHIESCLKSVQFADEIIVVDNQSTDATAAIAKKYTKHVFTQVNNPIAIDYQKNYGFLKATKDWILSIDADESITDDLREEILSALTKEDDKIAGYWIPRKNIIFGKWIQHSLWWPDYQLRLFKKGTARYGEKSVHKPMNIDGATKNLTHPFIHQNYSSISQYILKMNQIYTESDAIEYLKQHPQFHWQDAIRLPVQDFLKTFFLQNGYRDGFHGLALSILQSIYMELVVLKAWEKQGFPEASQDKFLTDVVRQINQSKKEFNYWHISTLINETNNPAKKLLFKTRRKFNSLFINHKS